MADSLPFPVKEHEVDVCVVGGGIAGVCAALAAARQGASVVLMQERPVLGGNSSSETRVHICGADRHNHIPNMRETGILEELRLENLRKNPNRVFSIWDTVLWEKVRAEPNITLLLNCTCMDAETSGTRVETVVGWQLTTETYHLVTADCFVDCTGDGILAPLTGAEFRMGREARAEYGESIAPEVADERTMGMSILFQTREYPTRQIYEAPEWAYVFESCDDLPYGARGHRWWQMGYWWVELGGEQHAIYDTEELRDELLRVAYGVWDHIKNRCEHKEDASNWALDWMQFLPAKRESRRYVGDHVLSQPDVEAEGRFDDLVAYGGWTMDDHHPAGFWSAARDVPSTIFHHSPSPYGIPYRALYSKTITNLWVAGRCASCTHAAMSSTRVMGTCASMGQAVGTACAMAAAKQLTARALGQQHMDELQQALLKQDCYLPWHAQSYGALTMGAMLEAPGGNAEALRDGLTRPVGDDSHAWDGRLGDTLTYQWDTPAQVERATLVLDSALSKNLQMSYHQSDDQLFSIPEEMVRGLTIQVRCDDSWQVIATIKGNYQRVVVVDINQKVTGVRVRLDESWGAHDVRVYAFYLD